MGGWVGLYKTGMRDASINKKPAGMIMLSRE